MLTFEPSSHTYRWHGQVVPSVTQVLNLLQPFAGVPKHILEVAQERGTFVHAMTEAYDLGELDEEALALMEDGLYMGYLKAWKAFIRDRKPVWDSVEERDYHDAGFAGTWDRTGTLDGEPEPWVIDIKSSLQDHKAWGMQTAAYRAMRANQDPRYIRARRGSVQLRPDGRYRFLSWDNPADWPAFCSLLNVYRWSKS
jgi:hypothetical protein